MVALKKEKEEEINRIFGWPEASWLRGFRGVDKRISPTVKSRLCEAIAGAIVSRKNLAIKALRVHWDFDLAHALTNELQDLKRLDQSICYTPDGRRRGGNLKGSNGGSGSGKYESSRARKAKIVEEEPERKEIIKDIEAIPLIEEEPEMENVELIESIIKEEELPPMIEVRPKPPRTKTREAAQKEARKESSRKAYEQTGTTSKGEIVDKKRGLKGRISDTHTLVTELLKEILKEIKNEEEPSKKTKAKLKALSKKGLNYILTAVSPEKGYTWRGIERAALREAGTLFLKGLAISDSRFKTMLNKDFDLSTIDVLDKEIYSKLLDKYKGKLSMTKKDTEILKTL